MRPSTSNAPPAANGTTIVRGRVGHSCAPAMREAIGSAAAPAARRRKRLRGSFMLDGLEHIRRMQLLTRTNVDLSCSPAGGIVATFEITERRHVPLATLR